MAKRLAKVEQIIHERLKRAPKHYNKSYSGEFRYQTASLTERQSANKPREYLFCGHR